MYPYKFVKRIFNIGVGVEGLSLLPPQTLPLQDTWLRPRYQVQRSLAPQAPAFVKQQQQFQPVALTGNGSVLQGQMALQALSQLTGGGE